MILPVKNSKRLFYAFALGILSLCTFTAEANDYLEVQRHYQVYTPYLYMVNESGVAGRGLAAVPYYSQAKPISYTNPLISETILASENSGTMYVPTSDSGLAVMGVCG